MTAEAQEKIDGIVEFALSKLNSEGLTHGGVAILFPEGCTHSRLIAKRCSQYDLVRAASHILSQLPPPVRRGAVMSLMLDDSAELPNEYDEAKPLEG